MHGDAGAGLTHDERIHYLPQRQTAGPTVFAPFPKSTEYFGSNAQPWMINFRVRDLDAMVHQLQTAGILVEVDPASYPNGRLRD